MNLKEAIESGKRYRRAGEAKWNDANPGLGEQFSVQSILAEDFVTEPTEVTITAQKFWCAFADALKDVENKGGWRIVNYQGSKPPPQGWESQIVQEMAKKLGLE
jgi:hypothetical protein